MALKSYVGSRIKASVEKDPEDIIQDVAYNLFAGADGYGPISNVAGFVYRSIKNKLIDGIRKKKTSTDETIESDTMEAKWIEFAELMYEHSEPYSDKTLESLKAAMAKLSPMDREIILAVDIEDYTFREISEETGTPEGTLMSRRHRALSKLNKTIKRELKN